MQQRNICEARLWCIWKQYMHLTWAWWVGSEREGISKLPVAQREEWASVVCADLVFFSFCVSSSGAGGLVFLRGRRNCCCCWLRLLPSPRRKLSCHTHIYVQLTTNAVLCKHIPFKVIKISCVISHHFLGMFVTKRCLVSDVKHRNGALLSISETCRATGEQLLRAIQQDICINVLSRT